MSVVNPSVALSRLTGTRIVCRGRLRESSLPPWIVRQTPAWGGGGFGGWETAVQLIRLTLLSTMGRRLSFIGREYTELVYVHWTLSIPISLTHRCWYLPEHSPTHVG